MSNNENVGFVPDFRAAWENAWPKLLNDVNALVLVAFRVLVLYLEQHGFFNRPRSAEYLQDKELPQPLRKLYRNGKRIFVPEFVALVSAHLDPRKLDQAAELASAIDLLFGSKLSAPLRTFSVPPGDPRRGSVSDSLQDLTQPVNEANRVLMGELSGLRPIILIRPPEPYWAMRKDVVPEFLLEPQTIASRFHHLVPTETRLSRVCYSALGANRPQRIVVALWPVEWPGLDSPMIKQGTEKDGEVPFYFTKLDELSGSDQQNQVKFAKKIADYIGDESLDVDGTVHIVAAPELTLAPESLDPIIAAIKSRRNAVWIVFPGSYHVEADLGIINEAPVYVGGMRDPTRSLRSTLHLNTAAVKNTPVVFAVGPRRYVEGIDGRKSLTHVLDTSIGRIAVMICFDFIKDDLRNDVVSMCADHLVVLSMSPDKSGRKFAGAMEGVSNYRTSCFYVNAFKYKSRRAAHRLPLTTQKVKWMSPNSKHTHHRIVLEPE